MRRALVRRRFIVAALSLLGALITFALVIAAHASKLAGEIVYAPWVMLIGVDSGPLAGVFAGAGASGLWIAAASISDTMPSASREAVRIAVLCILGFVSGVVGNQLRATERARSTTVDRQRALIDATVDGICLTDVDGNLLIVNEPLTRMATELGMPTEGTVPERLLAIADTLADPERYRRRMLEIAESSGEATSDEFELLGTGRVFRGYTSPVHDRRGRSIGRVWTLREVTADKELERMRDAFVATVSHELRTPLTSISGFIEMLEDEDHGLGETGHMYLDVIRRSTERLHNLVEDLLLVAQIEAQRVDLKRERVDLAAVTERAVDAVRPWASEKHVRIDLDADDVTEIPGDERRLGQVVDNLLSNAIKFSPEGGAVRVRVSRDESAARVVVSDSGIGIPEEEQGHVFSRFYRASSAQDLAVPGTGLGLAITRALVDQHGGTIELESSHGEGTTVTVTLPLA